MDKLLVTLTIAALFYSCSCYPLSARTTCSEKPANERYYRDCRDAYEQGQTCSGVYTILPDTVDRFSALVIPPFDVYCDMEIDGGGWTVFQRRMDGSQDFYRNWDNYTNGFGDLNGEFWLGLSKIHRLTANTSHTNRLRVDLGDFEGNTAHAKYSTFRVGDSASKYTLTVNGYSRGNEHCAHRYTGAWWYHSCYHSNLNGFYYQSGPHTRGDGVVWHHWKGTDNYSLKVTEMKVRCV